VNLVGSDPSSDVPLPAGSAAAKVGRLIKEDQRVSFEPAPDANVRIDNVPVRTLIDLTRSTRLTAGRVTFFLHASGDRLAIRVRDPESELRRSFRGLRWFPVRPFWRITGRFVPFDAAKPVVFQNILGDLERYSSPGEVAFEVNGVQVRLQAVSSGERLWFIFSDATAGRDTYPIRFLYADAPAANGDVTLDFNRAYNPPCAYNPHTTCPRPPAGNFLKVPITAGEKRYSP
jgi:uncharacterized protein (DUF1684 family)